MACLQPEGSDQHPQQKKTIKNSHLVCYSCVLTSNQHLQDRAQQNHQNFAAPIVCAQAAEDDQIYLHFTAEASEEHNT